MRTACPATKGTMYLRISSHFGFLLGSSFGGCAVSFDLLRFAKAGAVYTTRNTMGMYN